METGGYPSFNELGSRGEDRYYIDVHTIDVHTKKRVVEPWDGNTSGGQKFFLDNIKIFNIAA